MLVRIGYFFTLVSLLVLFVFAASYQVDTPKYSLMLVGLALFALGVFLIVKNRPKAEDSNRFRMIRRMRKPKSDKGENRE